MGMRVEKFWAKGYRSLRDVVLDPLGEFNVFYGPNGSGKTNVIEALQTLFCVMPLAVDTAYGPDGERLSFREAGREAAAWIGDDDFFAREDAPRIVLGAVIADPLTEFGRALFRGLPVERIEIEVNFWRVRADQYNLRFTRLYSTALRRGSPSRIRTSARSCGRSCRRRSPTSA